MKKWLLGIITILGASQLYAVDQVCVGGNCPGMDRVQVNGKLEISTASFKVLIASDGITFGDGTTQTTAGGGGAGGSASFFTFTDNSGNKTAISSMTFPAALFNRTVSGSSITIIPNPSSFTLQGPFISSIAAQTVTGANLKSTNNPTDQFVPKYDAATGNLTWAADNNSGGGGSSGDNLTSSTMVWMNGGATPGAALSFQVGSSTMGYVDQFGTFRWGNWSNSRPVYVGTNSWVGIGLAPLAPLYVNPNPTDGDNSGLIAYFDGTLNAGANNLPPRVLFRPRNSTAGQFNLDFNVTPGHSVWKYNYNLVGTPQYFYTFQLNFSSVVTMRDNWRVGINTTTPQSVLQISSGAGATESILLVSTGATKLFEITGASITAYLPLFDRSGVLYSTGDGIGAPGSSGGSNIYPATATASFPFGASMATITVNGAPGFVQINTTEAGIAFTAGSLAPSGTFYINRSSADATSLDFIYDSTDVYFVREISQVRVATSVVNMATMTFFNNVILEQQRSTGTQEYMLRLDLADMDTKEPQFRFAVTNSTGVDPNPIQFTICVATETGGHVAPTLDTLIWNSTFSIVTSTPGYATVEHFNTTAFQLTGWANILGSGIKEAYLKITNVTGSSTIQRVVKTLALKKRKRN